MVSAWRARFRLKGLLAECGSREGVANGDHDDCTNNIGDLSLREWEWGKFPGEILSVDED